MSDEKCDVITGEKNPIVALVLNFCLGFFGVGYFYLGQWQLALVFIVVAWITGGLAVIFMVIDAYMQAKVLQEGGSIKHWSFLSNGA